MALRAVGGVDTLSQCDEVVRKRCALWCVEFTYDARDGREVDRRIVDLLADEFVLDRARTRDRDALLVRDLSAR